jgi:hypothetical protein
MVALTPEPAEALPPASELAHARPTRPSAQAAVAPLGAQAFGGIPQGVALDPAGVHAATPPQTQGSQASAPASGPAHPLVVGLLLLVAPPLGLAVVWASPAYGRDARWALSAVATLTMLIGALFGVIALLR